MMRHAFGAGARAMHKVAPNQLPRALSRSLLPMQSRSFGSLVVASGSRTTLSMFAEMEAEVDAILAELSTLGLCNFHDTTSCLQPVSLPNGADRAC